MSKRIIIANWKVNPQTSREALILAFKIERGVSRFKNVEVVLAPPYPFLTGVGRILKKAKLGAQNTSWVEKGALTGEVSWFQLKRMGIQYVIVGHSERRWQLSESEEYINKKVHALLKHGMTPILCIGEREREGGDIPAVVGTQLKNALVGIKKNMLKRLIVAYEPVWAISTTAHAKPDTPDNTFRVFVYIQKVLTNLFGNVAARSVRIIYGGSVNASNAYGFLHEGKMEGALVGGVSLNPAEFSKVVEEASRK
jgi:triosephosphate isomerase (TIM)